MGRGFARARSSELQRQRADVASVAREVARPLWNEVHAVLGNAAAHALAEGRTASPTDLYLLDVLRAASVTGHDFRDFLPWRAPPTWTNFAHAWYRVVWAEQSRDAGSALPSSPVVDAALGFADGGADVNGSGELGSSALDIGANAPSVGPAEVATSGGLAIAAAGAAPALSDAGEVQRWFVGVEAQSGAGRPLTPDERAFLARVYGRPAPDVRVHEGPLAAQASRDIEARAFTVGDHVWFGESPDLSTPAGAELLAHEVAHVFQNSVGKGAQQQEAVSSPGQPLEIEAEHYGRVARRMQPAWNLETPAGTGPEGRYLAAMIASRLPATPAPAPMALVRDGVRSLLAGRVHALLAEHTARIAELRARGAHAAALAAAERIVADARTALLAPASDASLAALARIAGTPSMSELDALAATFAPYPDFAERAGALLAGIPASESARSALFDPLSVEADALADTAALTQQLVSQLVASLHLGADAVRLHTGSDALDRLGAVGARGLAEGRDVYLDPTSFDPRTADGRALVAHEVVHVAQGLLPAAEPLGGVSAGALAEAEAHFAADRLVAGGTADVQMGLPFGHVAAEGSTSGKDLKALLAQYRSLNEGRSGGFQSPAGAKSSPKANGSEDGEKKLEQYQDGVDGIADLIGDLDAFDDLCEAVDDEEEQKAAAALKRIKGSDPYRQLCRMYQGAKEGGAQRGAMFSAFEQEFDDRGFWGSTEEAFRRVRDGAKRDAKPEKEAQQARAGAREADQAGKDPKGGKEKDKGKGGPVGQGRTTGIGANGGAGDLAALEAATVEQTAPVLPGVEQLKGVTDDQLSELVEQRNHQSGLAAGVATGEAEYGRTEQILGDLAKGFAGGALKGFTDGMVQEALGYVGEKAVRALSKGAIKTPFVGPLLGLISNNPLSDDYWSGLFGSEQGKEGKFVKGWQGFKSAFDWSQFQGKSGTDFVGVLCAKLADFFGGLRDIIDGIATLLGTLSAVAYVAGGILMVVGLALVWLAGVGAPLITAGGWLIRAGGILSRISSGLDAIAMTLTALTLVFRTAAAFMVPAEMYADQLVGVGDASSAYGEKVGGKVADKTADNLKGRIEKSSSKASPDADSKGGEGEAVGKADGDAAIQKIKDDNDAIAKAHVEAQEKAAKAAKTPEGDGPASTDGPDGKKSAEADGAPAAKKRSAAKVVGDLVNAYVAPFREVRSTIDGLTELGPLFKEARLAGAQGAYDVRADLQQKVTRRTEEARAAAERLRGELDDIYTRSKEAELDPEAKARLDAAFNAKARELFAMADKVSKLESMQEGIDGSRHGEARDQLAKAGDQKQKAEDARDKEKETQKRLDKAREQVAEARKKAEASNKKAKELKQDLDAEQAHVEGHRQARGAQNEAKKLEKQQASLRKEADTLRKEAEAIERRARLEGELSQLDTDLGVKRSDAKGARSAAKRFVGQDVDVTIGGRTVKAEVVDASPDGLIVRGPSGEQTVPYAEVADPKIREAGERIAAAEKTLADVKSERAGTKRERDGTRLRDPKADPADLRKQAEAKQTEAKDMQGRIDDARERGSYAGSERSADDHADRAAELQGKLAAERSSAADGAREVDALEEQARAVEAELKQAQDARKTADDALKEAQPALDFKAHNEGMTKGGGGYYAIIQTLMKSASKANEIARLKAKGQPVDEQKVDAPIASAGDFVQKDLFGLAMVPGTAKAIGERQAQLEALMNLSIDVDLDAMIEARDAARRAAERHAEKHAWAYAAFHAEKQVDGLSKETRALAKESDPIKKISASQQPGLDKARGDEERRKAALQGGNDNVAQPDSQMAGIVIELIQKIASFGDRFDQQPDGGSPGAGGDAAQTQKSAGDQAKQQKKQSSSASDEQRAALQQAIVVRQAQEAKLSQDGAAAQDKATQEEGVRDQIRSVKAQALSERDAAGAEAEAQAKKFNDDYGKLTAWATQYREARAKLQGPSK